LLDRFAQRRARPEQVLVAQEIGERLGAQAMREGRGGGRACGRGGKKRELVGHILRHGRAILLAAPDVTLFRSFLKTGAKLCPWS
jgi:hypothetical protein